MEGYFFPEFNPNRKSEFSNKFHLAKKKIVRQAKKLMRENKEFFEKVRNPDIGYEKKTGSIVLKSTKIRGYFLVTDLKWDDCLNRYFHI